LVHSLHTHFFFPSPPFLAIFPFATSPTPNKQLVVGGIGDSGAVLFRSAACAGSAEDQMYELTVRHSPGMAAERQRLEESGGWITEEQDLFLSRVHHMDLKDPFVRQHAEKSAGLVTTHRVNGELSVSRAIGDPDYKGEGLRA
jgi:serine/threonine protein phosphatase PrpC|tara:strand:+ start:170 stop:598 length:429 start_codon:yes stop_codon:yes gene_type:complete